MPKTAGVSSSTKFVFHNYSLFSMNRRKAKKVTACGLFLIATVCMFANPWFNILQIRPNSWSHKHDYDISVSYKEIFQPEQYNFTIPFYNSKANNYEIPSCMFKLPILAISFDNKLLDFMRHNVSKKKEQSMTPIEPKNVNYKLHKQDIHPLGDNMDLVEWVCIPPAPKTLKRCKNTERHLIIFNAKSKAENISLRRQNIILTKSPIPKNYELRPNHVALFHKFFKNCCITYFYHHFTEFYVPFFHLVAFSNKFNLTASMEKTIFAARPMGEACGERFSAFFLGSLNSSENGETYGYSHHSHPGNVCYRYGIFSDQLHERSTRAAAQHIHATYNVEKLDCPPRTIVLSKRNTYRHWTNIYEIQKLAIDAGFNNTFIVDFGTIPLRQQLNIAYCADILVGAQSSALTWLVFMKPHSSVVEIAWPMFGWDFFYSQKRMPLHGKIPLNYIQLETRNVTRKDYSVSCEIEVPLYEARRLLRTEPAKVFKDHTRAGKLCNFFVGDEIFLRALRKASLLKDKSLLKPMKNDSPVVKLK